MSIIPSSPMLTTPLRSENVPAIAPKTSGVENTNIDAMSDAVKTRLSLPVLECVARMPSAMPITPAAKAPQPRRRYPRRAVERPRIAAAMPKSTG